MLLPLLFALPRQQQQYVLSKRYRRWASPSDGRLRSAVQLGEFIDHCNYDQAGITSAHLWLPQPQEPRRVFREARRVQSARADVSQIPSYYSMADTGYVYVRQCGQQPCRVHIALHGCKQNFETIQDHYIQHAGYNEWADTNRP